MSANIQMADVTFHIDETLSQARRDSLLEEVRGLDGVMAVGYHEEHPHLMIVGFDPDKRVSTDILNAIKALGIHAEKIGL